MLENLELFAIKNSPGSFVNRWRSPDKSMLWKAYHSSVLKLAFSFMVSKYKFFISAILLIPTAWCYYQ